MSNKNRQKSWVFNLSLVAVLVCAAFWSTPALAIKMIPPRVITSTDQKVFHIYIKNDSKQARTYRFEWRNLAMSKDGRTVNMDKEGHEPVPDYRGLSEIVRYSPRRATLKPGDTQRVTFLMRPPKDAPAGEYRSHFIAVQEPEVEPLDPTQGSARPNETNVAVKLLVSRAIPVYVRHGETQGTLTLLGADLRREKALKTDEVRSYVHFDVGRQGNRSVIGRAIVKCTTPSGEEKTISKAPAVFAVYAEAEFRHQKSLVQLPAEGCSTMKVILEAHPEDPLSGAKLGEIEVRQ